MNLSNDAYTMVLCCFFLFFCFFLLVFIKAYIVDTHLNCIDKLMQFKWVWYPQLIQVGVVPFCKEVDKKYIGCILKTMELLDCALFGVIVLITVDQIQYVVSIFCKSEKNINSFVKNTDLISRAVAKTYTFCIGVLTYGMQTDPGLHC